MKKLLAILMCAALLFSLAACGAGNDVDEKAPNNAVEDDVNVDDKAEADDEADDDTTKPEDTTAAPETQPAESKISRGEFNGDVYTNAFAGFTFTKPADWKYLTDEEMAQTLDIGSEIVDLNAIEEALAKKASIYDMAAQNEYGTNSVMVLYENTMLTAFREISVDEYEATLKTNLKAVEGIAYTYQSSEDVKLGDATYRKILFSAEAQGVTMTQAYYIRAIGKYVVTVIITSDDTDVASMEALFTK